MLGWSRWINYLNPIGYGFESLMINEFAGSFYECSQFVPAGPGYEGTGLNPLQQVCSAVGSVPGQNLVSGTDYIRTAYQYGKSAPSSSRFIFGRSSVLMGALRVFRTSPPLAQRW